MGKKRIVVKIGSSSLTNEQGGIDDAKLSSHIAELAKLRGKNHDVILVSSGAVAAGFSMLGYSSRPVTLKGKQAAAAIGQSLLIKTYLEEFQQYGLTPAQILLTRGDFSNRDRYRNAFQTITELLERGIIPIINENDTVAIEELTFGDNDMLSALVSGFIHADQLIILTDINGLYDRNPRLDPAARRIDFVKEITDNMLLHASDTASKIGTGGMKSKLLAAKMAASVGVPVFIGNGNDYPSLAKVLAGDGDGTYIASGFTKSITTKRQWIAIHSKPAGTIQVDQGAEDAILNHGRSLLPSGVSNVSGIFQKGDVIRVFGSDGLLGKGEARCSSEELIQAIHQQRNGSKKCMVPSVEVIHRNDWVQAKILGRDDHV